jgi:hypothetical protein
MADYDESSETKIKDEIVFKRGQEEDVEITAESDLTLDIQFACGFSEEVEKIYVEEIE